MLTVTARATNHATRTDRRAQAAARRVINTRTANDDNDTKPPRRPAPLHARRTIDPRLTVEEAA